MFIRVCNKSIHRRQVIISESEKLLEVEIYFALSCFGTVKEYYQIRDYIEKFTGTKIFYKKHSIQPLYITREDPRKKPVGENKT